jgi:O-succinylbenzoate synthase
MRGGGVREALLVEGPAGWGECSPLPGYPCAYERARAAADGWPAPVRADVAVNALVASVGDAEAAVAAGYACLKVKVARDVELVAAVRDAVGPGIAIRVDANGAWDVDTAVAAIRRLAAYDVEFVEQPVASLDDLAAVRRQVDTPIAADECVRTVEDARRLDRVGAADLIVLKVQPLGGVRRALEIAEAAGVAPVVTSMMETSVGLAAGLALAAAVPDLPYACGLGTANVFVEDIVAEPLTPARGRLAVRRPVPDPGLLDRYRVAAA